ncbi:3-hydroxybutyryl-CoA dehydrogenase [Gracilibacillus halophilus YIM-C55.5]|uniref:3-hydroxybutyryl-CoA dehydrogenase n=1 Tax=Gracilibacillus halophilus YIM-C55.5 TaxID=1308866 RepID=N4W7I2_9BACI|nr:3-hydroxyacyl-CoA dehydrogenase [Gracilibacillus halophilus]ENH96228.1 3-hydroxybutyryl-CoA dehydrogenase [Gracilibacillus halophilus YIM-C55.5]
MNFKQITVAGSGVLGSQIAFQTAYKGFDVTVYDITEDALDEARNRFNKLKEHYKEDFQTSDDILSQTEHRITLETDLATAAKNADLVIEAIPEVVEIKQEFYQKLGKLAPDHTIFATNTSTLLPSQFAEATGRPEKFIALHFANEIWRNNTAEIMKHEATDDQVFNDLVSFAEAIGMVALPLHKEQPGYILNSLLVPLLDAAQMLFAKGVADHETIDKTWMIATGAPKGPFAILDVVGINTAYNIVKGKAEKSGDPAIQQLADYLKTEYIDQNKLGTSTGEGFYQYPNPRYEQADFLK